jgi:hypothetical protein
MLSVADTAGLRLSDLGVAMAVPKPSGTDPYIYPQPTMPHNTSQFVRTEEDIERFADLAAEVFENSKDEARAGLVKDFMIHQSFS